MIIKGLKLTNIRSYVDEQITFPESSVLLSGDIGAGKSSILLALEFALFGIVRGELNGESLLRKGAPQGSVELNFSLDNQDYTIKRTLKNSGERVAQHSGYLIQNGGKEEGTPVELKSSILSLLKYPEDSLTKKSLIYRYTVYTPQEEMKRILFDDKQLRLDTLRKVFNIDKYKQIQENCALYARLLRGDIKILKSKTEELPHKIKILDDLKKKLVEHDAVLNSILPKLESAKKELKVQKEKVQDLEIKMQLRNNLEGEIKLLKQKQILESERKIRIMNEKVAISKRLQELQGEIGLIHVDGIENYSQSIKSKLEDVEKLILEHTKVKHSLETENRLIEQSAKSILNLSACPTCKQEIGTYHSEHIKIDANNKILSINSKLKDLGTKLGSLEFERNALKIQFEEQLKREQENKLKMQKRDFLIRETNEKSTRAKQIDVEINEISSGITLREEKLKSGEIKLNELPVVDLAIDRQMLDDKVSILHKYDMDKLGAEKEIQNLNSRIGETQTSISVMEEVEERVKNMKRYHDWLEDMFTPLMANMEKHVFSQVHREFNSFFTEWFNILIEDEGFSVRLDEEFSPLVVQNGHSIDIVDLSGGEKTCVALAYRLALNKVINNMISDVKTKDLLILDEPTDGFSNEQLDKVRLVLDELNFKQVIIVSHESKIESFVDHVIRIAKEEHVSRVY